MLQLSINGYAIPVDFSTFPGGEEHAQISPKAPIPIDPSDITIVARLDSSTEIMRLLLLHNAILNKFRNKKTIKLMLGYLPYARQDRVCSKGEALSIKVMCDLINSMQFDEVTVVDCHSDVGIALLNNCTHISQTKAFSKSVQIHNRLIGADVLVVPDLGAAKKAQELADLYNLEILQCMKCRIDRNTIAIELVDSGVDTEYKNLIVADDICDGGGTFLALAKALQYINYKRLDLVVTHGIFSKGKAMLATQFDRVEAVYDWTK